MENVQKGKFREDLYYRLNTVPIKVPPLKERPEDIHLLFRKFASDFAERYRTTPVRLDERAQLLLENYSWPGNIRELKNIAQQVSALAESKQVDAQELLKFIPKALERNLPAVQNQFGGGFDNAAGPSHYEREILFKFLYEMRRDLADMKDLITDLVRTNDLQMPASAKGNSTGLSTSLTPMPNFQPSVNRHNHEFDSSDYEEEYEMDKNISTPIIINSDHTLEKEDKYSAIEEIEESLSLEDMEQELIKKALSKHRGRRKEAAKELGISERTLYRKIRQYEIEA
jgi:DNA-binding NtrC family response regulator